MIPLLVFAIVNPSKLITNIGVSAANRPMAGDVYFVYYRWLNILGSLHIGNIYQ